MKPPYHGNSAKAKAWQRGYDDARNGKPYHSGNPNQPAAETLAYEQGWHAAKVPAK